MKDAAHRVTMRLIADGHLSNQNYSEAAAAVREELRTMIATLETMESFLRVGNFGPDNVGVAQRLIEMELRGKP